MARGRHDYEKAVIAVESEGYKDLHGRILMQDDFEDTPLKWYIQGLGTYSGTRRPDAAYNGSYGMQLESISTAPPAAHRVVMFRYVPIDVTRRLELELFWRCHDRLTLHEFEIRVAYWDGTEQHTAAILYDGANEIWNYYNDLGAMVELIGSDQTIRSLGWNEVSLGIDFSTDEYIRMKSNNMDINMGGIQCRHFGSATAASATVAIYARNITANQLLVTVDDVVLKELER